MLTQTLIHSSKKILKRALGVYILLGFVFPAIGQTTVPLNDLSFFKNPGETWQTVGDVTADLEKENKLNFEEGDGILLNLPGKRKKGEDLFTNQDYGNIDLELDYMMAKGSNSGIYLQGRYEIQLLDSWGNQLVAPSENGGIYERWDDNQPQGQKGYQGYAPRQNVNRAPGLWQHLEVSFQAPRFDEDGNKVENAKILKAVLNGVVIHEDVELFGPTRGAVSEEEVAKGPLRFQGDHGAVAFRNIEITAYDKARPELKGLSYKIYGGQFDKEPLYDSLPPEAEGTSPILTSNLKPRPLKFLIRYDGTIVIKEPGEYDFRLFTSGGKGMLNIDGIEVIDFGGWSGSNNGKIKLAAGEFPFTLLYSKSVDWEDPALGLMVSSAGLRGFLLSDMEEMQRSTTVDPILVAAEDTPILRSFMDLPGGYRITHSVSVGSPKKVHYTYDMDYGSLVQLWRGDFLNATPMWHSRGDGSSRPQGSVEYFTNDPQLTIVRLSSKNGKWPEDTAGSHFRPKGYVLNDQDRPVFQYEVYNASIKDDIQVLEGGKGLQRKISIKNEAGNSGGQLYIRLAQGSTIQPLKKGMYLVDDKAYYLKIEDAGDGEPFVRTVDGHKELLLPVHQQLTYSILF